MKTAEPKSVATKPKSNTPFFGKEGRSDFFGSAAKEQPFFGKKNNIQAKLTIGQPNDKYEKEADAMADKVVQRLSNNTPDVTHKNGNAIQAKPAAPVANSITPFVQTKCASCEKEEKLQKKEDDDKKAVQEKIQLKPIFESNGPPPDDEKNIQRKCAECGKEEKLQKKESNSSNSASGDIESSLNASIGSGSPLPADTKTQMESSLGANLSGVRIHNDSKAAQMCSDLNAQAFTNGKDIYFNSGKYDTSSSSGKHLLTHELTHTVQQGASVSKTGGGGKINNKIQMAKGAQAAGTSSVASGGLKSDGSIVGRDIILTNFPLKHYSFNSKSINAPAALINNKKQPILKVGGRKTKQNEKWKSMVQQHIEESLIERRTAEGLQNRIQLRRKNKQLLLGKPKDLAKRNELINPKWNIKGENTINEIEHQVDALIAGNELADDPCNLMLLDKKANRSIGSGHVVSIISNSVNNVLESDPNKDSIKGETFSSLRKEGHVKIDSGVNTDPVNPTSVWEKEDFNKSKINDDSHPLSKKHLEVISGEVPAGSFVLKPSEDSLGYIVPFGESNNFTELKPDNATNPTKITATIKKIFNDGEGFPKVFEPIPPQKANLVKNPTDGEEWSMPLPDYGSILKVNNLSPLEIDKSGIDFNPYTGLIARGKVKSDIPLLTNAEIAFEVGDSNFTISAEIDADFLADKFPKPFSVDLSTLSISASSKEGFRLDGQILFSIDKIGKGDLKAEIGKDGFSLEGNFNFDSKLFDPAKIGFSYEKKQWSVGGQIGFKKDAVKGIKSGNLTVSYANDVLNAQGIAIPSIEGFKQIQLGLNAGPEGFEINGAIEVEKIAGIKSGKGTVRISNKGGENTFEGAGKILPDIPGITSEVDFTINNDLFNVKTSLEYKKDRLEGILNLGVTNEGVGTDGNPNGKKSGKIRFYGGGSLSLMITDSLKATAGVQILENGEVEVSGKIELPKAFQLFPAPLPLVEKELLPLPAIHIPLFAIPLGIANIGLEATIAPHLTAAAEIGPGNLTNVAAEVKYNPAHPEQMTVTGNADFEMRVYAMIKVGVDFDIGISAAVASVSGGIGLNAGVKLEAQQPLLHTELKWSPKSGFDFAGLAQVILSPKLFFTGDAHITASALMFSKTWRWPLVNKEFDPGLDFGMKLPFHYSEGQPFHLGFEDIQFVYPKIDMQTIKKITNKIVHPLKDEFI